jgi:release factor glutamine methyltransferase
LEGGPQLIDRTRVVRELELAGCVAASEEADDLFEACAGDELILQKLLSRRTAGEPIAWVTGKSLFCGLSISVAPGVYVPRWQSEQLARRAIELLPSDGVAVDLCTGTGAIAAAISFNRPRARVLATEIDRTAALCARSNGVEVLEGSLFDPLPKDLRQSVDVVTAVVPYVPTGELQFLPRDVKDYEPQVALDGGAEGTQFLLKVVESSPAWLRSGGSLLLELGGDQHLPISAALGASGFQSIELIRDDDEDIRGITATLARAQLPSG